MLRAFVGLSVAMPTVAERRQQSLHADGADLVAQPAQRSGELMWLFNTHSGGRIRLRSVAGSTTRRRSSISVASSLTRVGRPPPGRRMRLLGNDVVSSCFKPRPSLERAYPVILATASSSPRPAARTSPAANRRRRRSSSLDPTSFQRQRIACVSIMPKSITPSERPRNPLAPCQITEASNPKPI
jgi:hypothetical protein